jgi:hypothetical protein
MKRLTEKFLKKENACQEGFQWFLDKGKPKDAVATIKALMADDKFSWANWLIVRLMTHDQKIKYAIYAAEKVIDIYEKKYPGDKRPRAAILAAKKYIKHKTPENEKAVCAAADAADAAADAAYAAADAAAYAADAAYAAALAAAYAAYAAYAAAYAADAAYAANAAYAAAEAAEKELKIKIINYGIKLLVKQ